MISQQQFFVIVFGRDVLIFQPMLRRTGQLMMVPMQSVGVNRFVSNIFFIIGVSSSFIRDCSFGWEKERIGTVIDQRHRRVIRERRRGKQRGQRK